MDVTPRFWKNLHVPDIINPSLTVDCFKIKITDILTKKDCKNEALVLMDLNQTQILINITKCITINLVNHLPSPS